MKRIRLMAVSAMLCLAVAVSLTGCGTDDGRTSPSTQQGVSDVMQERMQQDEEKEAKEGPFTGDTTSAYQQVDFDLTAMNSDMVYATVFDMMENPSTYEGKVIKMKGPYYHTLYESTGKDYFYVIIQDATACCAQGLEFVWDDGSHTWPNEYPDDGTEVVVTGRFKIYQEESKNYAHLVDASLEAA